MSEQGTKMLVAEVLDVVPACSADRDRRRARLSAFIAHHHNGLGHSCLPSCRLIVRGVLHAGASAPGRAGQAPSIDGSGARFSHHVNQRGMRRQVLAKVSPSPRGAVMPGAPRCIHCDRPATAVTLEVGKRELEIHLCKEHVARLLRRARPAKRKLSLAG